MRSGIAAVACVVALALVNMAIADNERVLAQGRVVYLELAPVDPRSLMQGDYMALRFKIAGAADAAARSTGRDGRIVAALDEHLVATFKRMDAGEPLAGDEVALRYRIRGGQLRLATNAFFFQEGTASIYEKAKYGEFRLSDDGDLLLVGLRGAALEPLGRNERPTGRP